MFPVICHTIIIFTLLKYFISYSFASDFFIVLRLVIMFNIKKKLLMYILTMLVLPSNYWIRMLGSPLSCLKPILLKKAITFQFKSFLNFLSLYKLLNSLHNSFSRIWQSLYIPSSSRINMGNLLLSKRFFRYAPTIST